MTNNHTKKSNHPKKKFLNKKHVPKKSHPVKIKIKKNTKKRGNVNAQEKKKWQLATWLPKKKKGQPCCLGKREERKKKCNLN